MDNMVYDKKNTREVFYMSQIILYLAFFVYAYFADKAIYYIKTHILGQVGEVVYGSLIAYYGQRIVWAFVLGWAAIPIALIHKNFIAK